MLVDQVNYIMTLGLVINCKWDQLIFHRVVRLVWIHDKTLQIRVKPNNSLFHASFIQIKIWMFNTRHDRKLFIFTKKHPISLQKSPRKSKLHISTSLDPNWLLINYWLFCQTVDQSRPDILYSIRFISPWAPHVQASAPRQSVVQYRTMS